MSAAPAVIAAQRRPERQPRLHLRRADGIQRAHARSTKAGASTPATLGLNEVTGQDPLRSTKAGASTPATRPRRAPGSPATGPLNEGRSVNPGYTRRRPVSSHGMVSAQRRPERQPRLHSSVTKYTSSPICAQRRPERQPRLHGQVSRVPSRSIAAQRRPERQPRLHRARPTSSIVSSSAQRRPERQPRLHLFPSPLRTGSASLNEGRSVNPGYTRQTCSAVVRAMQRSTKAGASTPATPSVTALLEAVRLAQRRPERQPRLHVEQRRQRLAGQMRSTKAGASTPATPGELATVARGD